jgi:hypothetical protein
MLPICSTVHLVFKDKIDLISGRRKALKTQAPSSLVTSGFQEMPQNPAQMGDWSREKETIPTATELPSTLLINSKAPLAHSFSYLPSDLSQLDPLSQPLNLKVVFPLAPDHLISLVQYNVLRACLRNMQILSLFHTIPPECTYALAVVPFPADPPGQNIPESFRPTAIQMTVPHPQWIGMIPHPQWRDNLIVAQGTYNQDEMCDDIVGGLWDGFPDDEVLLRGVVAWDTPWDVGGWEVSEGFLKKWSWVLRGCEEVLEATNRWRALRSEEPLVFGV